MKHTNLNLDQLMKNSSLLLASLFLGLAGFAALSRAEVPEPDNIVYGTVTRGSNLVTAADTDVVVEARRNSDGAVVASYRMGDSVRSGNRYTLRVPLEVFNPLLDPLASTNGTPMTIVARDLSGDLVQVAFNMGGRGQFTELNLGGVANPDTDADGLLDAWELATIGNLSQVANSDADGDGASTLDEYTAGTHPNDPNSRFRLNVQRTGGTVNISFTTQPVSGVGYEGLVRRYTLESRTNLMAGAWLPVVGVSGIVGTGQTVQHSAPISGSAVIFFRTRITLVSP